MTLTPPARQNPIRARKGAKGDKPKYIKMKTKKKNIYAAYWTTIERDERELTVNFRFPMDFGLLRAADWAEKEILDAADWLAEELEDEGADYLADSAGRSRRHKLTEQLHWMMPLKTGRRKLLHRTKTMELTLGGGNFQIVMTASRKSGVDEMADQMEAAVTQTARWMRENAYVMQLQ